VQSFLRAILFQRVVRHGGWAGVGSSVIVYPPSAREPSVSVTVMFAPAAQFFIVLADPFNEFVPERFVR